MIKICPSSKSLVFITILLILSQAHAQLMRGPEVHENRSVTFRIHAPWAQSVKIINLSDADALGAEEYALTKEEDNEHWSVTTKPCRPGLHYYDFDIDGARVSDPACPSYFGWGKWTSCVEVPGENLDFYLPEQVAQGNVRFHWYFSKTTQNYRKCLVYTPPGYESSEKRYPVLFLQHGAGESELGWTMQGKCNFILDNLIAARKATPMIIVMDNGYAPRPGAENPFRPRGRDNGFTELVTKELIPMIDREYRTLSDRKYRAIAGLSMGGGQALRIGLSHPDLFASVAGFSGGLRRADLNTAFNGIFKDATKFNDTYKLFFLGYGTLEQGYEPAKNFSRELTEHGIKHAWSEPVGSHEWQVWRVHLYEFAQLLFK